MNKEQKSKLVKDILFGIFAICAIIAGTMLAINMSFKPTCTINFIVNDASVEISGSVFRGKKLFNVEPEQTDASFTLNKFTKKAENKEEKYTWRPMEIPFTPQLGCVQYRMSIKNLSTEDITLIPQKPVSTIIAMKIVDEASETLRIEPGETREYRLAFEIMGSFNELVSHNFTVDLQIVKTSSIETDEGWFSMDEKNPNRLAELSTNEYSTSKFGIDVLRVPDYINGEKVLSINDGTENRQNVFSNLLEKTKYLILPKYVTRIGARTFYEAETLVGIYLPRTLEFVGEKAFYSCKSLFSLYFSENVSSFGSLVVGECLSLEAIRIAPENETFYGDNCVAIGDRLLFGCRNAKLPDDVVTISENAFYRSPGPEEVTLPSSVTTLEKNAFNNCFGLRNLYISENVDYIGKSAFGYCSNLETIRVSEENQKYSSSNNGLIEKATKRLILGCQNTILSEDVEIIGSHAFEGQSYLKEIEISAFIKTIETSAFKNCPEIKEIVIPETIVRVEQRAFDTCTNLEKIYIRDGVSYIGNEAFNNIRSGAVYIIDSAYAANNVNNFTSKISLYDRTIIYIKESFAPETIENYDRQETSDREGYVRFTAILTNLK